MLPEDRLRADSALGAAALISAFGPANAICPSKGEDGSVGATVVVVDQPVAVAIVDYSLPLLNGVEVTRQIRQRCQDTEVIIFTMHDNNNLIQDLLQAGALGYLLKSDAWSPRPCSSPS